jgi:hypothetical protein
MAPRLFTANLMTWAVAATTVAGHPSAGRKWVPPAYQTVERRVVIPAQYRTIQRRVWIEPVYEYRTETVSVPAAWGLDVGLHHEGLHFGLGFGGPAGSRCETVQRLVCVQPGQWRTIEERVLVQPERVQIVHERVLVRPGYWQTVVVSQPDPECRGQVLKVWASKYGR